MFKVHRLVAMVYIPNPDNKPCVCHKDNDRMNPYYKNLYWGTYKENNTQCLRDGRGNRSKGRNNHFYGKRGEKHPASVLSDRDRLDILSLYKKGKTQKELGNIFGVSQDAISRTIKKYTS